jgi:hypothetical protein
MEGVTDFVLKEARRASSDVEEQEGPVNSGKKMAEIIESTSSSFEKKFLHDYAYSIFEAKLLEEDKIKEFCSSASFGDFDLGDGGARIVKIKAKAKLIDAAATVRSLETLVDMQQCLSILSANDERAALISELLEIQAGSKSQKTSHLLAELARLSKPQIAKEIIANDKLHYENMAKTLSYGYKSRLDVFMQLSDCVVSADLKRVCLKDEEDFIVKTYSRVSDVDLVLVGILTRVRPAPIGENDSGTDSIDAEHLMDSDNMNEILMRASQALHGLEKMFTQLDSNQVILDPIAVYVDL